MILYVYVIVTLSTIFFFCLSLNGFENLSEKLCKKLLLNIYALIRVYNCLINNLIV